MMIGVTHTRRRDTYPWMQDQRQVATGKHSDSRAVSKKPAAEELLRDSEVLTTDRSAETRSVMFKDHSSIALNSGQGRLATELVRLTTHDIAFARVTSTGHLIELDEADNITFLMPARGSLAIRIADNDYRVATGTLSAFRPTHRITRAMPDKFGAFVAAAVLVPMRRIRAIEAQIEASGSTAFPTDGIEVPGDAAAYLHETLGQLVDDLVAFPLAMLPARFASEVSHLIDEQLCEMLGRAVERKASRRALPALSRLRPALDILHSQSDEPLSILHLSQSLGVGIRSLQLAFNETYGQSPREVLNSIRLQKARQSLLAAKGDAQVTVIAMDCGFSHLGRFSKSYHAAFGERPKDTLARHRA